MPFPLSEQCIIETERKLALRLPEAYRIRMLSSNGGILRTPPDEWQLHPILDNTDRKRLSRTSNDIIRETRAASEWTGWPERAIAVGENGAGDRLVLLRSPEDQARCETDVYWWDHETGQLQSLGSAESLFAAN